MLAQLIVAFFAVYGFYSFLLCVRELVDKWWKLPRYSAENDKDDSQDNEKSL